MKWGTERICERCQLIAHGLKLCKVLIIGIIASGICYYITRRKNAGEGIDMSIGIVAGQLTMLEPKYFFCAKILE